MEKYSLIGIDGNAFSVMAYVKKAMKKENVADGKIDAYLKDAMSGDYNNLLVASMKVLQKLNQK